MDGQKWMRGVIRYLSEEKTGIISLSEGDEVIFTVPEGKEGQAIDLKVGQKVIFQVEETRLGLLAKDILLDYDTKA